MRRDFDSADWHQIKSYLDTIDFYQLFQSSLLPPAIIDEFYKIINTCIDLYVPIKRTVCSKKTHRTNYPPNIRRKLRKKATAWHVYQNFKTPESLAAYKQIASDCKSLTYSYFLQREKHLVENGNLGKFFRYANSKFCSKSTIAAIHKSDGSLTTDPLEKASILQQTLVKNFTADDGRTPRTDNLKPSDSHLSRVYFTPTLVRRAIKKLKPKTAGGPDGIPPPFLLTVVTNYPILCLSSLPLASRIVYCRPPG